MTMPLRAAELALDQSLRDGVAAKDRYGRLPLPLMIAIQTSLEAVRPSRLNQPEMKGAGFLQKSSIDLIEIERRRINWEQKKGRKNITEF
jgi:hypothetical protein